MVDSVRFVAFEDEASSLSPMLARIRKRRRHAMSPVIKDKKAAPGPVVNDKPAAEYLRD